MDNFSFDKLHANPSLSDRVAKALLQKILKDALPAGSRLPSEIQLVQEFGVSRTVVREAISRLKNEGAVEGRQGSGIYVTEQARLRPLHIDASATDSAAAVLHIFELRRALETEGAALAAVRHTLPQMQAIDEALAAIDTDVAQGGNGVHADIQFHRSIAMASGNPFIPRALDFYNQYLEAAIALTRRNESKRLDFSQQVDAEHKAIAEAVRQRDATAAREATAAHLFHAARRLEEGGALADFSIPPLA